MKALVLVLILLSCVLVVGTAHGGQEETSLEEWCKDPWGGNHVWDNGTCYADVEGGHTWGTVFINTGERLVVDGPLGVAGQLYNAGRIDLNGSMSIDNATLTVLPEGRLVNQGELTNSRVVVGPMGGYGCIDGEVTNYGNLVNMGRIYNSDATRGLSCGGDITNFEAVFYNYSYLLTLEPASFYNLGLFYHLRCSGSEVIGGIGGTIMRLENCDYVPLAVRN